MSLYDAKVGDTIYRRSGGLFSNGSATCTVSHVEPDRVWLKETSTYICKGAEDYHVNPHVSTETDSQALKADAGKLQWSLVTRGCANALLGIVKVMTVAVTPKPEGRGYAPDSWKLVPDAKKRYEDALFRHLSAIARGEVWDDGPEGTGQLHWDCVATNAFSNAKANSSDVIKPFCHLSNNLLTARFNDGDLCCPSNAGF